MKRQLRYTEDARTRAPQHDEVDSYLLRPRLVHGDSSVGLATVSYVAPVNEIQRLYEDFGNAQLKSYM
jgi:hypothetical protein